MIIEHLNINEKKKQIIQKLTISDERRDEELLYHPMTLRELQDMAPVIDWRAHFEDALRIVNRKVTEKERVVVYAPEYLMNLTKIVQEYNATDDKKMYGHFTSLVMIKRDS